MLEPAVPGVRADRKTLRLGQVLESAAFARLPAAGVVPEHCLLSVVAVAVGRRQVRAMKVQLPAGAAARKPIAVVAD